MKIMKLAIAAGLTALVLTGLLYVTDPRQLQHTYLCWKQAVSILPCYGTDTVDFVAEIDGIKYEGNTGNYTDNHIYFNGAFDKHILFLMRDLLQSVYKGQGNFIDIGANTGQQSLVLSRYAREVHAFEPWEPVLKRFRRMVDINGVKNIAIHAYGLGNENSKKPFFKPGDKNLGTGSFVEGFKPQNSYEGELEIRQGDDAFGTEKITAVSLIKMDIEGYEKLGLQGLRRTLAAHRPIIVFELTVDPKSQVSIKSKEELTALFPERYEFLVFGEKSDRATGAYVLEPIEGNVRFDQFEQYDLVAYPAERKNSVSQQGPIR